MMNPIDFAEDLIKNSDAEIAHIAIAMLIVVTLNICRSGGRHPIQPPPPPTGCTVRFEVGPGESVIGRSCSHVSIASQPTKGLTMNNTFGKISRVSFPIRRVGSQKAVMIAKVFSAKTND